MYTSHGHHIPGTVLESVRPIRVARCGGVSLCKVCKSEAENIPTPIAPDLPKETPVDIVVAEEDFIVTAKALVRTEIISAIEELHARAGIETKINPFTVKVVWACKTLQNWKAWVISDFPDRLMYEVTHNGDKKETYIDTYEKQHQTIVPDSEEDDD